MKRLATALVIMSFALAGAGCSSMSRTFKNLTGQNDDSVLPGTREDVLPPEQQTARDPVITGEQKKECDPTIDPACPPAAAPGQADVDQESSEPIDVQ